ncbi:MAG: glycoside hydrolase family 127 protein [Sedimentisphaerales bacterium]|nr:glycoside hydrolase family 127 protein [Sedimentisphaerales bacterium]
MNKAVCFFLAAMIYMSGMVWGSSGADYPFQPVPFTAVKFTDQFWLSRMEVNRVSTIPFAFKMCEDTNRIENFKIAGKLSDKLWDGEFGFNDTDVYKVIEGASYSLMVKPDAKLDSYLDEVISYIAAAQEPDGYLYTAYTAKAREHKKNIACCYHKDRWDDLASAHELYNLGHMYEAAAAHYQATGKRSFLDIAIKSADLVVATFAAGKNEGVPGHEEIEIGLVKLYRATGDERYLQQSKWFLHQRGRYAGIRSDYSQSHKPLTEQTEAVGHAVRANYVYTAMADVAAITGDVDFVKAIDAIWQNVADKKLYITGGIGARHAGEAYGDNYELPNRSAYCETCAAIANVYWNQRMFLFHGDSRPIDIMERSLYNALLSGVSLDGMKFFYPNPLESVAGHERSPWFGCACCPSNICRFIASVPGYVYAVRDKAIYVNMYVDSESEIKLGDNAVNLRQVTRYPWEGRVELTVNPAASEKFAVNVRIPDWTGEFSSSALYTFIDKATQPVIIAVNGQEVAVEPLNGYVVLDRKWQSGDIVTIDLPMEVRRLICDERVVDNVGKMAIQRGPLVYCVEGADVEGGKVLNLLFDKDSPLEVSFSDELNGVVVISGTAFELHNKADGGKERVACRFRAIPYYAWAHRGKMPMAVWLPYKQEQVNAIAAPTIASRSKVSVSFLSNVGNTKAEFVNDQLVPRSSGDHEKGFLHFWPHKGTTEYVQYDFAAPASVSNVSVYWFDDTGRGECRIPSSWQVLYREGDEFKPVQNFSDYKVTKDDFDGVSFLPVQTDGLRLMITGQDNFSTGVHEFKVE